MIILTSFPVVAQDLPGSADPGRIRPLERPDVANRPPFKVIFPEAQPSIDIPDAAKQVRFKLSAIQLEGVSAFTDSELESIYEPYLNREITLDIIWMIAGQITELYQNAGFFLSRAYVPAQEIDDGAVIIKVAEGSIGEVNIENAKLSEHTLVRGLVSRIKSKKPLSAYNLEAFMLQMNALPGVEFRAFVEPVDGFEDGVARLSLRPEKEKGKGLVSFDNLGSRFLGPYQGSVSYQHSFIPLQQTNLSVLTSIPADEMKYVALSHSVPVYPDWTIEFSGAYSTSAPGYYLKPNNIKGESYDLGMGINWQPIRQRQENLIASLEFTGKNTSSDILNNNPLAQDNIRAVRGKISYDIVDSWSGYNYMTLMFNQGLEILGSSKEGDLNLSRAEGEPDFASVQFDYTRQQALYDDFVAIGQVSGQFASGPLLSSEEFGYGGQSFGRAYDTSEIIGEHGLAGSLEFRYLGLDEWQQMNIVPYTFYDIGKVWNEDAGSTPESGSSAGVGMRITHDSGLTANFGLAYPLTRSIDAPINGDADGPRYIFQMGYSF